MAVAQRSAQVIPFPDANELAAHSFRREGIKEELHKSYFKQIKAFNGVEVLGIDKPRNAIVTPFFANRQADEEQRYARLSTNLPTDAVPGIHELKVVGSENLDFFMFELHEPQAAKRTLTPRELKKIADKRIEAVERFSKIDMQKIDAYETISIVRLTAQSSEPFQTAQYLRWRIATRGEDPSHPPKFPTLEVFFRGESTYVVYDQYPYPPTQRTYRTNTVET